MYFHNTFATFTILIVTLAFHARISHAQNSPQDFVDAHNAARTADGVGALAWDDTVAAYAEQYASSRAADCALMHSDSGGLYGENLAQGTVITGLDAVQMWVDEKSNYDYGSNTCADGTMCGHYTQVVWANSVSVGCARVQCDNGDFFVTCNYSPPGNVIGQRPF